MTGFTIGAFELSQPLAQGGMGVVWRGTHLGLGVPVALKAITASRARHDAYRAAFRSEVRAVAGLAHPGVVALYDHGRIGPAEQRASEAISAPNALADGSPYLVMELAPRGTLEDVWYPPVATWEQLRSLLLQLLSALAHAHARGVLHGDLKPRNILVCGAADEPPTFKLADFGLVGPLLSTGGLLAGTPTHMAPEQFVADRAPLGPPTDLYQLGCVAWELCCGQPPHVVIEEALAGEGDARRRSLFKAYAEAHRSPPLGPVPTRLALPGGLDGWLRRLLAPRPTDRFGLAAAAAHALRALGPVVPLASAPAPLPAEPFGGPGGGTTLHVAPRSVAFPATPEPAASITWADVPAGSPLPPPGRLAVGGRRNVRPGCRAAARRRPGPVRRARGAPRRP